MQTTVEELVLKIAKEMELNSYDTERLVHDINNLRGSEWLEEILECCSAETFKEFSKLIKTQ